MKLNISYFNQIQDQITTQTLSNTQRTIKLDFIFANFIQKVIGLKKCTEYGYYQINFECLT